MTGKAQFKMGKVNATFPKEVSYSLFAGITDTPRLMAEAHPDSLEFMLDYGFKQRIKDEMAGVGVDYTCKPENKKAWVALAKRSGISMVGKDSHTFRVSGRAANEMTETPPGFGSPAAFKNHHKKAFERSLRAAADAVWERVKVGTLGEHGRNASLPPMWREALPICEALGKGFGWKKSAGPAIPTEKEGLVSWLAGIGAQTDANPTPEKLADAILAKATAEAERKASMVEGL